MAKYVGKITKKEREGKSPQNGQISRKIIQKLTGPIGLKFFVSADFGHGVLHTKFQPLRLKDVEDIAWCG